MNPKKSRHCGHAAFAVLIVSLGALLSTCDDLGGLLDSWASYEIVYQTNESTVVRTSVSRQMLGEDYTVAGVMFSNPGYHFDHWELNGKEIKPGETIPGPDSYPAPATYMTAVWIANKYTINFDPNGGSGTMNDVTLDYDEEFTLTNAFNNGGATFLGWALESMGQIKFLDGESVSKLMQKDGATVTLYAVWSNSGSAYAVTFDANGATGNPPAPILNTGQVYTTLPNQGELAMAGSIFIGWADNANLDSWEPQYTVGSQLPTIPGMTIKLYATWEKQATLDLPGEYFHDWYKDSGLTDWAFSISSQSGFSLPPSHTAISNLKYNGANKNGDIKIVFFDVSDGTNGIIGSALASSDGSTLVVSKSTAGLPAINGTYFAGP